MAEPRIPTRVGDLAVRVVGDGPPAVLWHSLFVDARSWDRVVDELAHDRTLVIITGPGHGASADPGHGYSLDDCAAAAGEVLDTLGIDQPVDWLGNAWGGHVGVVFAATWPARCRTLITFGTPIQGYGRSERLLFRALLAVYRVIGMRDVLSRSICETLLSASTRAHDPAAVVLVLDSLRTMRRGHLSNAMHSISIRRPDLSDRLAAITCPTLFVTGTDHAEWSGERATASARALRAGAAVVVPDTAYLTPLEAPSAVIDLVREWWASAHAQAAPTRRDATLRFVASPRLSDIDPTRRVS